MNVLEIFGDGSSLAPFLRDVCLPMACVLGILLPLRGILGRRAAGRGTRVVRHVGTPRIQRRSHIRHPRPL